MAPRRTSNADHAPRFDERGWGGHDFDALDEFVGSNPSLPGPFHGPEDVRATAELLHGAFPDMEVEIDHLVATDDWITQRLTATGTHDGALLGIGPTGNSVAFTGTNMARIEHGRWVEGHELWDMLGLFQQLDAVELQTDTADPERDG